MNFYLLLILLTSNNLLSSLQSGKFPKELHKNGSKERKDWRKFCNDFENYKKLNFLEEYLPGYLKLKNYYENISQKKKIEIEIEKRIKKRFSCNAFSSTLEGIKNPNIFLDELQPKNKAGKVDYDNQRKIIYNMEIFETEITKILENHWEESLPGYLKLKNYYDNLSEEEKIKIQERIKKSFSCNVFSSTLEGIKNPDIFWHELQSKSNADEVDYNSQRKIIYNIKRFATEILENRKDLNDEEKFFLEKHISEYFALKNYYENASEQDQIKIQKRIKTNNLSEKFKPILEGINNPVAFYNMVRYHIEENDRINYTKKWELIANINRFEKEILYDENEQFIDLNNKISDGIMEKIFEEKHNIDLIKELINKKEPIKKQIIIDIEPNKNMNKKEFFTELWNYLQNYNENIQKRPHFINFLNKYLPRYLKLKNYYDNLSEEEKIKIQEKIKKSFSCDLFSSILEGINDPAIFWHELQSKSNADEVDDKRMINIKDAISIFELEILKLEDTEKLYLEEHFSEYFKLKNDYENFSEKDKTKIQEIIKKEFSCDFLSMSKSEMQVNQDLKRLEKILKETKINNFLQKHVPEYFQIKNDYDSLTTENREIIKQRVNKKIFRSYRIFTNILNGLEEPSVFYRDIYPIIIVDNQIHNNNKKKIISNIKIFESDILNNRFTLAGFYMTYKKIPIFLLRVLCLCIVIKIPSVVKHLEKLDDFKKSIE